MLPKHRYHAYALDTAALALNAALAFSQVRAEPVNDGNLPVEATQASDWRAAFTPELVYKGSVLGIIVGAESGKSAYHGDVEVMLTVDGERLVGWPGLTVFFHVLNNHGGKLNGFVQSAQGVDNTEVDTNATKLYEAWAEQRFADDRASVLAGLYDLNSEFYVSDAAGMFLHPAFGIGSEFAQTGRNGPSIFPTTAFGVRLKYEPAPRYYVQGAVLDGVPGDPDNPRGTHVILDEDDGVLWVAEAGIRLGVHSEDDQPTGKIAIGGWGYSETFDDLTDVDDAGDPVQRSNLGMYLMLEKTLYRHADGSGRGLDFFLRYGFADEDVNQFEHAINAGVTYTGLLDSRPEDILGFGIAAELNSKKFRRAAKAADEPAPAGETALELSYKFKVKDWLWLQPDIQYVINHGESIPENALIAGMRFEIAF